MSKLDRRNQARQKQQVKHQEKIQATSIFAGQTGAPRHIAIIPLTPDVDTHHAIHLMNESVDVPGDVSQDGISRVRIDRFRQNVMYIPAKRDLISALDTCRLADFVVLVLSAKEEVDETGELLLRAIEGQGISNVQAAVQVSTPCL
jgi:pre-rRNA-processing protein TSR1